VIEAVQSAFRKALRIRLHASPGRALCAGIPPREIDLDSKSTFSWSMIRKSVQRFSEKIMLKQ
jgi:Arc/MetJ family transcription regulator